MSPERSDKSNFEVSYKDSLNYSEVRASMVKKMVEFCDGKNSGVMVAGTHLMPGSNDILVTTGFAPAGDKSLGYLGTVFQTAYVPPENERVIITYPERQRNAYMRAVFKRPLLSSATLGGWDSNASSFNPAVRLGFKLARKHGLPEGHWMQINFSAMGADHTLNPGVPYETDISTVTTQVEDILGYFGNHANGFDSGLVSLTGHSMGARVVGEHLRRRIKHEHLFSGLDGKFDDLSLALIAPVVIGNSSRVPEWLETSQAEVHNHLLFLKDVLLKTISDVKPEPLRTALLKTDNFLADSSPGNVSFTGSRMKHYIDDATLSRWETRASYTHNIFDDFEAVLTQIRTLENFPPLLGDYTVNRIVPKTLERDALVIPWKDYVLKPDTQFALADVVVGGIIEVTQGGDANLGIKFLDDADSGHCPNESLWTKYYEQWLLPKIHEKLAAS